MDFDKTRVIIPEELQVVIPGLEPRDIETIVDNLWMEVMQEILDQEYITRQHHNTGTYDKGCRGPLCRKAYREHPRRRPPLEPGELAPRIERAFDPIMEYFHTVIRHRIRQHQLLARQEIV